MKVLIAGCSLAGLSTALGLVTKFEEKKKKTRENDNSREGNDDDGSSSIEIVIVERRGRLDSRGATFGLAKNGQLALQEIAPPHVLRGLQDDMGIYMAPTQSYLLPWWQVRDSLLRCVQEESPYKEAISIYLGCVVKEVLEDENMPLEICFEAAEASTNGGEGKIPPTQNFDLLIGADGVHSQIRTRVLQCPPPVPTDALVWRGSVDTNPIPALHHLQDNPLFKLVSIGEHIILAYFNLHSKMPGTIAWVLTVRNASKQIKQLTPTSSPHTPDQFIQAYLESLPADDPPAVVVVGDAPNHEFELHVAELVFNNTHDPHDLTWSTEMAVVDLESPSYCKRDTNRWGGRGRITLVGDAAHSLRPASGLGGSLAFEDATVLSRCLFDPPDTSSTATAESTISSRLARFEALRLPRCQSLSRDQTWRSTLSYAAGIASVPAWDPQYRDWIFEGPDAAPHPPVNERDVFGSLLPASHEA